MRALSPVNIAVILFSEVVMCLKSGLEKFIARRSSTESRNVLLFNYETDFAAAVGNYQRTFMKISVVFQNRSNLYLFEILFWFRCQILFLKDWVLG